MFVALRPAGILGVFHPHCEVMTVVAALAKRRQVAQVIIPRVVIKVRHREHHPGTSVRVGRMVGCPTALTVIACPVEPNEQADPFPAARVQGLVFDGHQRSFPCK